MAPKRKNAPTQVNQGRQLKRNKIWDARTIRTQTSDAAYSNGELNVDKFVKARAFEIKALEDGIRKARNALSTRAHQELPRELRRRTASHNVKRVPKRLRERHKKEVSFGHDFIVYSTRSSQGS
jgi:ribonuclease P/MRP protein subunit POP1